MSEENNDHDINDEEEELKAISLQFIGPGSTLAYPVYDDKGKLLYKSHTTYSQSVIEELKSRGIEKIYYFPSDAITEKKQKKSAVQKFLEEYEYQGPRAISKGTQTKAINLMDRLVDAFKNQILEINSESIAQLVDCIHEDLDENEHELVNLIDSISYDDYIYAHSLNVGVIAMYFAKKLRIPEDELKDICTGAFLHDIGTSKIPKSILYKEDKLTDAEDTIMKEHSEIGFDKLKGNYTVSDRVKEIVYNHHERYDGSGYPRGLKGDEVSRYVEIVSLANIFDAITSERPYRKTRKTTEEALKIIMDEGRTFRQDTVKRFVKEMVSLFRESNFYPEDSYVVLNTNELAKVVKQDKKMILRPLVKIISNHKGVRLKNPIMVDLKVDLTREITRKVK